MATFAELLRRVRFDLSEPSAVTWSDEELFLYLKEGYKLLHNILSSEAPEWLVVKENYTIPSGDLSLEVPSGTIYIYAIHNSKGEPLLKIPLEQCLNLLSLEGSILKYWARQRNSILFAPKVSAPQDITLYRVPFPQAVSHIEEEVPLSETFHNFIVEYAVIRAHNRNERPTLVEQNFLSVNLDLIRSILSAEGSLRSISPTIQWNPIA